MFLTAEKIHDGRGWMPDGTVIEVSEGGMVLSVDNTPNPDAAHFEGVLCPGFVNAHCHLELSHMKGLVKEHTKLFSFLKNIPRHRNDFTDEQKKTARHEAYNELLRNGVVAVGDIANTTDTLDVRALEGLDVHTFVEALGFNDETAHRAYETALHAFHAFSAQRSDFKELRQSIVPHAPYSVSESLFRLINTHRAGSTISIHNQESREEDKYFKKKEGAVRGLLEVFGIDDAKFKPSGKSSLQTYLEYISLGHAVMLVHNTYTSRKDVQYAVSRYEELYWCLCPNANLYIENRLPDIDMLLEEGARICIGTDSLASNHQLCVLTELYTIKKHYPSINWSMLLSWGTLHGAAALGLQSTLGLIEPGRVPGILQVTGLDTDEKPVVRRIV